MLINPNEEKKLYQSISSPKTIVEHNKKYSNFLEILDTFYEDKKIVPKEDKTKEIVGQVHIEPKILYSEYNKQLKLNFKIGIKALYRLKSLSEFYLLMKNKQTYRYGAKLEFTHKKEAFLEKDQSLLEYILEQSEMIHAMNQYHKSYYSRTLSDDEVILTPSGLDRVFQILMDQAIDFENTYVTTKVKLVNHEPDIYFKIETISDTECRIKPNIEVYNTYTILEGEKYTYFLLDNKLYRCSQNFTDNTLKLLEIFRKNIAEEIIFDKEYLTLFYNIVVPKMEKEILLEEQERKQIQQYIPERLGVKMFLDMDQRGYITAKLKFCYGDREINPLVEETQEDRKIARNTIQERDIIIDLTQDGFRLDQRNHVLVMPKNDDIYEFLTVRIEEYMRKFEVLATENLRQKQMKSPKLGNIGVKVENQLLQIDFSQIQIDKMELQEIMKRYSAKKKYYRLKNGSFLNLEENPELEFMNQLVTGMGLEYKELEKNIIRLPIYRSMYLEKLLEKVENVEVRKNETYTNMIRKMEKKGKEETIQVPQSMLPILRYYQKIGYQWLKTIDQYQFGGILADDMGLGKTIQVLAILLAYKERTPRDKRKPSLVIAPSSLSLNWQNEAEKFTKELKVLTIHGTAEQRKEQIKSITKYDLVITSYDLLKRDMELYEEQQYVFRYMIVDEAQYIKNANTQNSKAIKNIMADTRYALTGTPIENSLAELWSIFDYIMPGYLFRYRKFKQEYEIPIIKEHDEKAMQKLKMLIEPFILRRTKQQVLTELPEKTITVLNNQMTEEQNKIYVSYLAKAKKELREELSFNHFENSRIKILALLTRLRQICCHPSLFLDNYHEESGKLNQCMELIKDAIQSGHKILLFSGYTSMFGIIEEELKKQNIEYVKLTGATKVEERIHLVGEFNQNKKIKVFLISLKAGGTGLNLTGADMVIHYDPWWNLSVENQATDRAYRIGQKNNVQVYKLITKNSIEEKIYELQKRKAKLANTMLDTKNTLISQLSKEDILALFE